jgi:branched-chain amino acid transport system substrate-binding protein
MQGSATAHFVGEQLQLKNAYIISDKSDFGQATANAFSSEAKKMGLTVSGLENTDEKVNFDSTVTAIKSAGADAVFFTGAYVQGGNLLRQLRDKNVRAAFIATERIDNPDFPRIAGQGAEGIYFESTLAPASAFPDAAQFIRDYKTEFNKDAPPYAAQAYDATAIALKAMATLAKDGKPTRKALAQAIRATQGYKGITGTYTFNSNGDPTSAKYFFVKVTTADPRRWEDNPIFKFVELAPLP